MEDLEKKIKSANKQFTQLKAQLEDGDEGDDDLEDDQSHFQFVSLANKAHHAVGLKQSANKLKDLDLRGVILLDNQSTMSLFCNRKFVSDIRQSDQPLTLRSNGGSMKVTQVASINNSTDVWFSRKAITNILALKDVKLQYRVTYDSYDASFIVWREDKDLPNMTFKEHASGLHVYDPSRKDFSFVVTVEENMKPFSKRQILSAEKARTLLSTWRIRLSFRTRLQMDLVFGSSAGVPSHP